MKSKITLEEPMLRINIGYKNMVLPWACGVQVFNALKDARFVNSEYAHGKSYWGNATEEVSCSIFTPAEQAQLLMEGGSDEPAN